MTVTADTGAVCTATATDGGTWSCTPAGPLADGPHTLTATAVDPTSGPVTSPAVQITVQE